jgi:hypothetical protein
MEIRGEGITVVKIVMGQVDWKFDLWENKVGLNLTPELISAGEIWYPNSNPSGLGVRQVL